VDFHDTTSMALTNLNRYRPLDAVGVDRTTDLPRQKFILTGGASADVYDYSVTRTRKGEWLNYGHGFPVGAYQVRLRQSLVGLPMQPCASPN
jgi:hypothetical protein